MRGRTAIATEIELHDPLRAILDRIRHSPATVESRLLVRVLHALTWLTADEDFSKAEVAALSLAAAQLLYATVHDRTSGRYCSDDIQLLITPYLAVSTARPHS
ncbi:MAG: hypothetical protein HY313_00235 [Acidobacteria bacterium]|nr:hypothetical protein [Acidobacteriota bacterium]